MMKNSVFTTLLISFIIPVIVAKDSYDEKKCAACHVVVDKIENEIESTDPDELLDVESYRVDPNGKYIEKKVKYARSETHMSDIMDEVCKNFSTYIVTKHPETGETQYVNMNPGGDIEKHKGFQFMMNIARSSISEKDIKDLAKNCEYIIDEHEDEIIEHFKAPSEHSKEIFCEDITKLCRYSGGYEQEHEEENEGEDEAYDEEYDESEAKDEL